jgi:hypothetical protein
MIAAKRIRRATGAAAKCEKSDMNCTPSFRLRSYGVDGHHDTKYQYKDWFRSRQHGLVTGATGFSADKRDRHGTQ